MNGNATQFIGTVEHGSLLPQNENLGDMRKEHVLGEKIYSYLTKDNTVRDGSQNIFAPQQQTSDIMHEENIAENYATQNIGNDPHVAQWRKFGFGFSKKTKGQRRHRGY